MTKLQATKCVVTAVVGIGASQIVRTIISNNVQAVRVIDKITVTSGAVVLGMMVSDISKKYTDNKIDEAVAWYKENFSS